MQRLRRNVAWPDKSRLCQAVGPNTNWYPSYPFFRWRAALIGLVLVAISMPVVSISFCTLIKRSILICLPSGSWFRKIVDIFFAFFIAYAASKVACVAGAKHGRKKGKKIALPLNSRPLLVGALLQTTVQVINPWSSHQIPSFWLFPSPL